MNRRITKKRIDRATMHLFRIRSARVIHSNAAIVAACEAGELSTYEIQKLWMKRWGVRKYSELPSK